MSKATAERSDFPVVLRVDGLSVGFDGRPVTRDVSFELRAGRTVALVGESGSGKSLTSAAIMGLLPPGGQVLTGTVTALCAGTGTGTGSGTGGELRSPERGTGWVGHRPTGTRGPERAADAEVAGGGGGPPMTGTGTGTGTGGEGLLEGTVWVAPGEPVRTPVGRGAAMIFQDPMSSLNPSMRVGWQVAEGPRVHRGISRAESRQLVERLFEEVELPDPAGTFDKYPHELSGGQKQRVMIALALAGDPTVLIADEPTTALDVTVQRAVLDLLKRLRESRGLAVLFITHDLDVVADIADEVLVMERGVIVEAGPAGEVLARPTHPYTRALIAAHELGRAEGARAGGELVWAVEGVTKSFVTAKDFWGRPAKRFVAVDNVSLEIRQGERVGLVGESGSGKSTLGRVMLGLTKPDSGRVMRRGKAVDFADRQQVQALRRAGQLVFQDPFSALNPRMTIGAALREVLRLHGHPLSDAEQLIADVGLGAEDLRRLPGSFSGGQRQRIVIARALVVRPEFLVLDESVAALDAHIQQEILGLLARLGDERGIAFLFISHDLGVVASFCSRVVVLKQGQVVEAGATERVWSHPQHPYTRELLASRPGREASIL